MNVRKTRRSSCRAQLGSSLSMRRRPCHPSLSGRKHGQEEEEGKEKRGCGGAMGGELGLGGGVAGGGFIRRGELSRPSHQLPGETWLRSIVCRTEEEERSEWASTGTWLRAGRRMGHWKFSWPSYSFSLQFLFPLNYSFMFLYFETK